MGGVEECGGRDMLCGEKSGGECGRGGVCEGVRCVGGEGWMWVLGG